RIVPSLIDLFRGDTNEDVRAAAASLLGKFVLLGELEAIPDSIRISVVNNLIDSVDGEERPLVKQRALESLGYSSHPLVPTMIRKAFESNEISWITSSLCAMGRSADESWANLVESKLDSPDVEVQFEAIRAAGELELATSREKLIDLLDEEIENDDNRLAAIWALSQIGGEEVKDKLETLLEKAGDEEEAEWIEKALENLEFSSSMDMDMLDLSRDHNEADINFDDSMLGEDDEEDDEDSEDIDDEDDFDEDE
ncbi:MAG TPA: HEAT repeat domain-containing protein, partial [Anaerolineaceae bacterium]|nr:HEAT repeat domain-containing protein [Anaerolineaceae bacterium]